MDRVVVGITGASGIIGTYFLNCLYKLDDDLNFLGKDLQVGHKVLEMVTLDLM